MHFHFCQDEVAIFVQALAHIGGVLTQIRVWVSAKLRKLIQWTCQT